MRIITWNCNMAFRKKAEFILSYQPDILIVPECEHPDKIRFSEKIPVPADVYWHGANANKGLGVFTYGQYKLKFLDVHNPDFRNILPFTVSGGAYDFTLFAVWANNPIDRDGHYVTQVWKAIEYYDDLLSAGRSILIGDFNSNTIWDKPRREGNHSAVVARLEAKNIISTYHHYFGLEQGKEEHATLYMYRHEDKPYHIDYCFASSCFMEKLRKVEIGSYYDWSKYSDHKPLIVEFDF